MNPRSNDNPTPRRPCLGLTASALLGVLAAVLLFTFTLNQPMNAETAPVSTVDPNAKTETAVLGGGCFWCLEAFYERVDGVKAVTSGYAGGHVADPTYRQVCEGTTGHAEVVKIEYDPQKVSYDKLLDLFWRVHDPTTLNRQGNDVGTQYRSVIFTENDAQKRAAEAAIQRAQAAFDRPIVTQVAPLEKFYAAEDYHQDYYNNNKSAPYCMYVVRPKLDKLPDDVKAK